MPGSCGSPSRSGSISHNLVFQSWPTSTGFLLPSWAVLDEKTKPAIHARLHHFMPARLFLREYLVLVAQLPHAPTLAHACPPTNYPRVESGQLEPMISAGIWRVGTRPCWSRSLFPQAIPVS